MGAGGGSEGQTGRRLRGLLVISIGVIAIAGALIAGPIALFVAGALLITCGALEMWETFSAPYGAGWVATYFGGLLSVAAGIALLSRPDSMLRGLSLIIAASFLFDGAGKVIAGVRTHSDRRMLLIGVINLVIAAMLLSRWPVSGRTAVVTLAGLRIVAAGWSILMGRRSHGVVADLEATEHPDCRMGLPAHPEFARLQTELNEEEKRRRAVDAYWCWVIAIVFLAIHIGRMRVDWNLVGMIAPLVAVAGDLVCALLAAFALVLPARLVFRRLTRRFERRIWERRLTRVDTGQDDGLVAKLIRPWLYRRARFSQCTSQASKSPRAALRWGMQMGLPIAAVLIAVNPIWGFSWFFNTESWATEVWNRWAEERTDKWREHMIDADQTRYGASDTLFQVAPDGLSAGDFSFLVLGDTGEGDASQWCLKDRILALGSRPDVRFLVVSSDVIYPSGAMFDYEGKFYLPFKGFSKPIYAIPGNHDWFDALESFAANFLEENAARAAIHARIEVDARLTSTTPARIDGLVREAARLRRECGVNNGHQRGPFFEIHSPRFSLIAADTGVMKTMDAQQWRWFRAALDRARGNFKFVLLGHPIYAGGRYHAEPDSSHDLTAGKPPLPLGRVEVEEFDAIHRLLREHRVEVVMAGDTHYFEHYREPNGSAPPMHHFVNGGGGAYISIGTPFDWPQAPAVPDACYYPRHDFLSDKLQRETPRWKTPLWWWVNQLSGWPLSAEFLSGAFDFNSAPYIQSFVEVRVERSTGRVRIITHGATGPLHWRDMQTFGAVVPEGKTGDDPVEFVIPLPRDARE